MGEPKGSTPGRSQVDFWQRMGWANRKVRVSLPREVLPGRTYMITHRCTQRQFLMRPDSETNNAFTYCLAEAAARCGVEVVFTTAMSNHHHTGIHDPNGHFPAFLEHFHKLFAKCQNALRGRWENFWSSEQTSVVRLVDPDDVLEKMVYALTNPVKDGLVEKAHHWPGVSALDAILHGRRLTARRPLHFFRGEGPMPESVVLTFVRPHGFEHLSATEFAALVGEGVRGFEDNAKAKRLQTGTSVLGRRAVLTQSWRDRPSSCEPRRQLNPRVAARSKWSRIEALMRNRAFREAYLEARAAFVHGIRDVVFPPGTYWLRRFAQVACDP
jgi:putative transposase